MLCQQRSNRKNGRLLWLFISGFGLSIRAAELAFKRLSHPDQGNLVAVVERGKGDKVREHLATRIGPLRKGIA